MKLFWQFLGFVAALGLLGWADSSVAGGGTSGCVEGSGRPKTVQRPVAPFRAVNLDGAFEGVFVFGKNTELSLTAEDNLLPHIVTEVGNGVLTISTKGSICATSAMKVRVGIDGLESIFSNGVNDIWLERVAGGSLGVVIEGSGNVYASGRADSFSVDIRGAADVRAEDLKADSVRIDISGAGDVEVFASKKIHVDISGAGSVGYHGQPVEVVREISGAGELIAR